MLQSGSGVSTSVVFPNDIHIGKTALGKAGKEL